jgi:hypothetical protein
MVMVILAEIISAIGCHRVWYRTEADSACDDRSAWGIGPVRPRCGNVFELICSFRTFLRQ